MSDNSLFYLVIITNIMYLFLENDNFIEVIKLDLKKHVKVFHLTVYLDLKILKNLSY